MQNEQIERWSWWRARLYSAFTRNPRSNRDIVQVAAPGPQDRVLDIGCGPGAAVRLAAAAGAEAIGVDPSTAMVDVARRRSRHLAGVRFEVGDAASLPLDDASITIAMAIATYHHWPDTRAGLAEVHRVLAPGGRLLIGERPLRRPGGHGLTTADTEQAVSRMRDVGFQAVSVQRRRLRLITMVVITATA